MPGKKASNNKQTEKAEPEVKPEQPVKSEKEKKPKKKREPKKGVEQQSDAKDVPKQRDRQQPVKAEPQQPKSKGPSTPKQPEQPKPPSTAPKPKSTPTAPTAPEPKPVLKPTAPTAPTAAKPKPKPVPTAPTAPTSSTAPAESAQHPSSMRLRFTPLIDYSFKKPPKAFIDPKSVCDDCKRPLARDKCGAKRSQQRQIQRSKFNEFLSPEASSSDEDPERFDEVVRGSASGPSVSSVDKYSMHSAPNPSTSGKVIFPKGYYKKKSVLPRMKGAVSYDQPLTELGAVPHTESLPDVFEVHKRSRSRAPSSPGSKSHPNARKPFHSTETISVIMEEPSTSQAIPISSKEPLANGGLPQSTDTKSLANGGLPLAQTARQSRHSLLYSPIIRETHKSGYSDKVSSLLCGWAFIKRRRRQQQQLDNQNHPLGQPSSLTTAAKTMKKSRQKGSKGTTVDQIASASERLVIRIEKDADGDMRLRGPHRDYA